MSKLPPAELDGPERDGEAEVGERITVLDLTTSAVLDYRLVDTTVSHPAEGDVSIDSALGTALLGRHLGDVITVERDGRLTRFEVVEIDG